MTISLANILEGIAGQNDILSTVIDTTAEVTKQLGKIGQKQQETNEKIAITDGIVQAETDAEAQRDELANAGFASSVGTNPNDPSTYRQVELGKLLNQKFDEGMQLLQEVGKDRAATLFTDPVRWLKSQVLGGVTEAKYETVRAEHSAIEAQLGAINSATQTVVNTNETLKAVTTNAVVKARQEAITLRMQQANLVIDAASAQRNLEGAEKLSQLTAQQLANKATGYNMIEQEKQRRLQEEDRNEALKLRKEALDAKKEEDAASGDMIRLARNGLKVMYGEQSVRFNLDDKVLLRRMVSGKDPVLSAAFDIGLRLDYDNTQTLGKTAADAAITVAQYNLPVPPEQKKIKDFLDIGMARLNANTQLDKKDKEGQKAWLNADLLANATQQQAVIPANDFNNIYQAPLMTEIAALPAVQRLPLFTQILKPQIDAGMTTTDPQRIVDLARDGVKTGTISYNDAVAGIQIWMNAGKEINNVTQFYEKFQLPRQESYNAYIKTGITTNKVDLTNYGDVTKIMSKTIAESIGDKVRGMSDYIQPIGNLGNPLTAAIFKIKQNQKGEQMDLDEGNE